MSGCETFVGTSLPLVKFISRLIGVASSIKKTLGSDRIQKQPTQLDDEAGSKLSPSIARFDDSLPVFSC